MSGVPTVVISGREGRHNLINDAYEPVAGMHNGKPAWRSRTQGSKERFIFHTGKARWCIGQALDRGDKCWAYIEHKSQDSQSPADCSGSWMCCGDDNQWKPDAEVRCVTGPDENDKFVKLRRSLEGDMEEYHLNDRKTQRSLWKRLDYNGNGIVSLAEIDKMVVEMTKGDALPEYLNKKAALMRAYKKTTLKDGDGDAWVERKEFPSLMVNIFWFAKLMKIFERIDTGDDRRIDIGEFMAGMSELGLHMSASEATHEFSKIDTNGGGQVLFVEFCAYVRHRLSPESVPDMDADIVSGEKCGRNIRSKHGHGVTRDFVVQRKTCSKFDELEKEVRSKWNDRSYVHQLWDCCDFNGNNICSLAEIDRMVLQQLPLLNHKPALMRAFKYTLKQSSSDDGWVHRHDFKDLLQSLFYFNKVYWFFDEVDGDDRRITFNEFKRGMALMSGKAWDDKSAKAEFDKIDRNGGGKILFNEFCKWVVDSNAPGSMTQQVGDLSKKW